MISFSDPDGATEIALNLTSQATGRLALSLEDALRSGVQYVGTNAGFVSRTVVLRGSLLAVRQALVKVRYRAPGVGRDNALADVLAVSFLDIGRIRGPEGGELVQAAAAFSGTVKVYGTQSSQRLLLSVPASDPLLLHYSEIIPIGEQLGITVASDEGDALDMSALVDLAIYTPGGEVVVTNRVARAMPTQRTYELNITGQGVYSPEMFTLSVEVPWRYDQQLLTVSADLRGILFNTSSSDEAITMSMTLTWNLTSPPTRISFPIKLDDQYRLSHNTAHDLQQFLNAQGVFGQVVVEYAIEAIGSSSTVASNVGSLLLTFKTAGGDLPVIGVIVDHPAVQVTVTKVRKGRCPIGRSTDGPSVMRI